MRRGIMPEEIFSRIQHDVEANISAIRVAVLYHGGEPLLNKHLPAMIQSLRKLGIPFIKTVSNGMLLTEDIAQRLVFSGLDAIEFSLDGRSAGQNNAIRRNCSYDTVVHNIKKLLDIRRQSRSTKPKVYLASTQFIQKLEDAREPPKAAAHLVAEFSGSYEGEVEFKCTWAMEWPHMELSPGLYHAVQSPDPTVPFKNHCDHAVSTLTVRWNGDIVPCCYDLTSRVVLGNIRDNDLATIWNNKQYRELRHAIHNMNPLPLCANCNVIRPSVYLIQRQQTLPGP